VRTRN